MNNGRVNLCTGVNFLLRKKKGGGLSMAKAGAEAAVKFQ